jgi:hypothetical protein
MARLSRFNKGLFVALAALLAAAFLGACALTPTPSAPAALPPGFPDTLPDVSLGGYVYASQEGGFQILTKRFESKRLPLPQGTPGDFRVKYVTAMTGLDMDSFAASLDLSGEAQARLVHQYLEAAGGPWSRWEGDVLSVVAGDTPWAQEVRQALTARSTASFASKYPEAWDLLQRLPSAPPGKPVAAGFVRLNEAFLRELGALVGIDMEGFITAFNAARVGDIAFAFYSDRQLSMPREVNLDYFRDSGLAGLAVARSSYPGMLVAVAFGSLARQGGLERVSLAGGITAYYAAYGDLHVLVRQRSSLIFLAASMDRGKAEALAASLGR